MNTFSSATRWDGRLFFGLRSHDTNSDAHSRHRMYCNLSVPLSAVRQSHMIMVITYGGTEELTRRLIKSKMPAWNRLRLRFFIADVKHPIPPWECHRSEERMYM